SGASWTAAAMALEHLRQAREWAVLAGPSLPGLSPGPAGGEGDLAPLRGGLATELEAVREEVGTTGRLEGDPSGGPEGEIPAELVLIGLRAGSELLRRLAPSCDDMTVVVRADPGCLVVQVEAQGLRSPEVATAIGDELSGAVSRSGGSCGVTPGEDCSALAVIRLPWGGELSRAPGQGGAGS
ncbi:MAG: hypothetical protein ACRDYD_06875, partial [Acidimicrobiales bacterium]